MGIVRLTLFAAGAIGAVMLHFGRDDGLPADRIGREPAIAQETIQPVSAAVDEGIAASPEIVEGEVISTANAAPTPSAPIITPKTGLVAMPVTLASMAAPQTPAEKAEAAARQMASRVPVLNTTAALPDANAIATPIAFVSGNTVNMRAGPSTKHGVVARLTRGTEVLDMGATGDGWSQIKVVDTGARGFMASKFLTR